MITYSRNRAVPTDRALTVKVEVRGGNGEVEGAALIDEMRRHMRVTSSLAKSRKRGAETIGYGVDVVGVAYRAWTRRELENQLRALSIDFTSVSVTSADAPVLGSPGRERLPAPVVDAVRDAASAAAAAVEDAITPDPAPGRPWWQIALAVLAVALGLGIATYALVGGKK